MTFRILNIGLDRDLLDPRGATEAQRRQRFYAEKLPARITHIVKAPPAWSDASPAYEDGFLEVWACPVRHFSLYPLAAPRLAARLLARERPDFVFAQEPFLSGTAAALVARRFDLPLIIGAFNDEIGNPTWKGERLINRLLLDRIGRAVYRRADAIRADSRDVAERLRALGFAQASYVPFLITNASAIAAPSPEAAAKREELLDGSEGPLLLTVARLEPVKDIPMMIDAFQRIRERRPGAVLAIIGDGRLRAELHAYAESKGVQNVRWVGFVSNIELPAYFQAADLFLLSSRHESSARVLSESMLAGLPVISTNTSGAGEVIEEGVTGAVVPIGDAQALADAVISITGDAQRLAAMKRRAREVAAKTVSSEAVIDGIRNIYSAVIRKS